MKNIVIVNFKTYKSGKDVLRLARALESSRRQASGVRRQWNLVVGVSACDVEEVASKTKLRVFCEHVDGLEAGRNTGFVLPEAVKAVGAVGVFLNHSEHKISFEVLKRSVKICRKVGLEVCVFVASLSEGLRVKKLRPDYLVVEPPELVGGSRSVSSVKGYVFGISKKLGYPFLVGAGVKSGEDVASALRDGAVGVAVSSGVVNAKNPGKVFASLVR